MESNAIKALSPAVKQQSPPFQAGFAVWLFKKLFIGDLII